MSPYASNPDVGQLNLARATAGLYGATSVPNATQVGVFIEDIAGQIDAVLRGQGYALPVPTTATSALKYLRGVNALGAAWRVEVASPTSDTEEMYRQMYESALAMLSGEGKLGGIELDAPKDSAQSRPRSNFGSYPGPSDMFFTASMRL